MELETPEAFTSPISAYKIEWSKDITLALISFWKKKECLYNSKCQLYHNKHARQHAIDLLATEMSKYVPNVTSEEIKTKIGNLRSQYGREVQKTRDNKSGAGTEDVYVPTAYWYDHLHFLKDFVTVRKSINNLPKKGNYDSQASQATQQINEKPRGSKRKNFTDDSSQSEGEDSMLPKRKTQDEEVDEALKCATEFITNLKPKNDYEQSAANLFCVHLKEIKNKDLRDEVVSKIMLLLMEYGKKQREMEELL